MEKYHKEISIKKFIAEYFSKTYIDPAYQRYEVWSESNRYKFIKSVYEGSIANPIILVNIELCLGHAKMTNNQDDVDYFEKIKNSGLEFISIDGNNRSQTINSYLS